jgi:hypothetical protein
MTEVRDVCVLTGPGYGQCWSCPVKSCELWSDPANPLSDATMDVVSKATVALWENRVVVEGQGGKSLIEKLADREDELPPFGQFALELLSELAGNPELQARLRVEMAAEAVVQNLTLPSRVKREHKVLNDYQRRVAGRMPTPDDEAWYEESMERAAADAAAEEYEADPRSVLNRLREFRGKRLLPTDRYREDRA